MVRRQVLLSLSSLNVRLNQSLFIFVSKPPSLEQVKAKSTAARFDWRQNNEKKNGTVQRVEEGRRADGGATGSR